MYKTSIHSSASVAIFPSLFHSAGYFNNLSFVSREKQKTDEDAMTPL